jgi:acetyl esterase/lipase
MRRRLVFEDFVMKVWSLLFVASMGLAMGALPSFGEGKPAEKAAPAPVLHEIEVQRDIAYYDGADADKEGHKLDVYSPKGAKNRPVVLFVHGGAWVLGNRDLFGLHAGMGRMFARHGVVAVVANYRLSPKVKHPEHIKDVARAFAWMARNAGRYGGSSDRLFLCGHSAGGHLVSLLATDEKYLKAEKRSFKDIKGVMSISGVYEIPDKLFRDVFGDDAETHRRASPLTRVKEGCPPFLILYAEKDYPTCDAQSEKFAKALRAKKVAVRIQRIDKRNHLDILGNATKDGDRCGRELLDFIAR